jgi:apolipoprotein N-acyltransferase
VLARTVLALVAGLVLALAFEPVAAHHVIPLCVSVLVLTVHGLPARRAWLPGLAFGAGFMGLLHTWMSTSIGPDAYVGITLVETAFFPLLAVVTARLVRLPWWPVWTALAWVAVESVRIVWPFSGMPWGRLGYGVADTALAPALPYVGFAGVSFLAALLGTTLAWLLVGGWRRPRAALPAVAALGAALCLPLLVPWQPGVDRTATVAAVQGDVPGDGSDILLDHRQVTANHVEATVDLAADVAAGRAPEPDLVVWPENSTAVDPFDDVGVNRGLEEASRAIGVPLLVGAIVDAPDPDLVLNQGIVWEPGTGAADRYTKWHPVPFGEYIPFRELGVVRNFGRLREIPRDMVAGTRTTPLRAGEVRVADAICFDVAYDDGLHAQVREGGALVVVQTSNAMFIHTAQVLQQFEITRLRAIETGRAVTVASTNGISGIIAPDGSVLDSSDRRTRDVLVARVPLSSTVTPAVRMGAWPGRVAVVATLLALLATIGRPAVPYRRRGTTTTPADRPRGRPLVGAATTAESEGTT